MTEYQLITGKPKIFAISNDIQLLKDVEEYVKDTIESIVNQTIGFEEKRE